MSEFEMTRSELAVAIKEQQHQIELAKTEYRETYGRTNYQQKEFASLLKVLGVISSLVIALMFKVAL